MNTLSEEQIAGLKKLREPFKENQISKLPQPTCNINEWRKLPKSKCSICGAFHATSKTIHLDYVGHAALTDRLLNVDLEWSWEPLALNEKGLPQFDESGGLWIRLTVCGMTRIGYGHAKENVYAEIGSREKEVIGDGLRNAAMRFGVALDLWHKGDLQEVDDETPENTVPQNTAPNNHGPGKMINATQEGAIKSKIAEKNIDPDAFLHHFEIDSFDKLKASDFQKAMKFINKG